MDAHGFPLLPHELSGVNCPGLIAPDVSGNTAEFVCNECFMIVGVLDAAYMRELGELINTHPHELNCPHCGATNSFPELALVDAFFAPSAANWLQPSEVTLGNG